MQREVSFWVAGAPTPTTQSRFLHNSFSEERRTDVRSSKSVGKPNFCTLYTERMPCKDRGISGGGSLLFQQQLHVIARRDKEHVLPPVDHELDNFDRVYNNKMHGRQGQ